MRKFGFTQISVAIDLHGDVFLFREAGFLNRQGNEKMIIGRISKNKSLEDVIKTFLKENKPLKFENVILIHGLIRSCINRIGKSS